MAVNATAASAAPATTQRDVRDGERAAATGGVRCAGSAADGADTRSVRSGSAASPGPDAGRGATGAMSR